MITCRLGVLKSSLWILVPLKIYPNLLEAKPAKFVHWEPYVNPTMEVLNTPDLIGIAKRNGASIVLDNTFPNSLSISTFSLRGRFAVIHSVTKYIGWSCYGWRGFGK